MIQENNQNQNSNFNLNNGFYANARALLTDSNTSFEFMSPELSASSAYSCGDSSGCYSTSTSPNIPAIQHVPEQQQQLLCYEQQVCATQQQQQHFEQSVGGSSQLHYELENWMSNFSSNNNNNNNDYDKIHNGLTHVSANGNNDTNNNISQLLLENGLDYVPQSKPQSLVVEPKICEISDASTVDDLNTDAEPAAPDENFSYLQGLNSDNLMQFSQQTVIQELMVKEHLDRKPNLDTLPTFEQHDYGGYNFQFQIHKQCKSKLNWVYSDKLNKVYIRMNQVFNIDAVFKPKMPMQQLRLRAFLCFVKEVSEPVLRCQNHISKDTDSHEDLRPYLLRCENPYTEYCGKPEGRSINERYSVLVPLNMCVTPQDDKSIKQTIALKFTCQNSCIGRKETSIVFLLEGMNGEVLAQRILDVKICSCPKRDRDLDEASKRKMENDICPRQAKVRKHSVSSVQSEFVKEELSLSHEEFQQEESDDDESIDFTVRTEPSKDGVRVVLDFSDKTYLTRVVDSIFSIFADKWFPVTHNPKRLIRRANKIRKMRDRALKIKRQ